MTAASTSQEFIDLADELFADGADGVLTFVSSGAYNPVTLTADINTRGPYPTKVVFVAPQQSTQIEFEQEVKNEDYLEHKVALLSYRDEINLGGFLEVEGVGKFTITGKVEANPLGITIFQRVKVSR